MQVNTCVNTHQNYSYIPISLKIEHNNDKNGNLEMKWSSLNACITHLFQYNY